jgi:glycosyltransferase involved in cell wall biosynthesis
MTSTMAPRPRVLHLITRWLKGGAEAKTRAQLAGLRDDYAFVVAHGAEHDPGARARLEAETGVACRTVPALQHYAPHRIPQALRQVRRLVDDVDPDLVHLHSTEAGAVGRWALRRREVPMVYTLHGMPFGPNRVWPLRAFVRFTERRLAPHTDRFAANAQAIVDTYLEAGVGHPDQYEVVYSGVDLDGLAAADPAEALPGSAPRVLFAGRLAEGKGTLRLARALERLRGGAGPDPSLLVAGSGPRADDLDALGHDWLHRLGYRDDLPSVMKACDVLALPSDHEGTPRVVTEAMACELPVVASRVGGIPEQVDDGESGLLVDPCDEDQLVDALATVLADETRRRAFAKRARAAVDRFSVETMLAGTDDLYREVLADR